MSPWWQRGNPCAYRDQFPMDERAWDYLFSAPGYVQEVRFTGLLPWLFLGSCISGYRWSPMGTCNVGSQVAGWKSEDLPFFRFLQVSLIEYSVWMCLDVSSIVRLDGTSSIYIIYIYILSCYVFISISNYVYIYRCTYISVFSILVTCGGFTAWSTFAQGGGQWVQAVAAGWYRLLRTCLENLELVYSPLIAVNINKHVGEYAM